MSFHFYADDTQLYLFFKPNDSFQINALNDCITDIKCWMVQKFLQLNIDKTKVIITGPDTVNADASEHLGSLSHNIAQNSKNLNVIFDNHLSLTKVNTVVQSCFLLQLRRLPKISPILSSRNLETVIHAFISTRLDYCNSHYTFEPTKSTLQLVQNAAARLLTKTKKERAHNSYFSFSSLAFSKF